MPKKSTTDRKRLLANLEQVNEELEHLRNLMQGEVDVELDEGDTEIVEREKELSCRKSQQPTAKDCLQTLNKLTKSWNICEI
jgi:hypothetical protein